MAHYENLSANSIAWKEKLLKMDVAAIKFQHKNKVTREREKEKHCRKKRFFG